MNLLASRINPADSLAVLLVAAYAVFASALAIRQHDSFHTHAFDMAYFDNVIWNTSQGRLYQNDLPDKPRNFLGDHFAPAIALVAPLYWLWSDPRILLIAQAVALSLGAVPGYLLLRQRSQLLALAVLISIYFNPAMLGIALSEFHEIALAVPFLAWAIYELALGRTGFTFFASILVVLLVKEELAALIAAIGMYLIASSVKGRFRVREKRLEVTTALPQPTQSRPIAIELTNVESEPGKEGDAAKGLVLILLASFWFILAWGIVPSYLPNSVSHWLERYGDIAPTPAQGAVRLLTDPSFLVSRFTSSAKWAAVARVLWPLAFIPLLAPSLFALALPVFAYLMVSNKASVSQFQFWYVAPLLPVLFVATAWAVRRAQPWMARLVTAALIVASLAAYFVLSGGPLAASYEPSRFAITERTNCAQRILQMIPPNSSVSAQDNLLPHLAHRATMHVFPSLGDPPDEYVVMDTQLDLAGGYSNWPAIRPLEVPAEVNRFLARPAYTLLGDGCGYKLLRFSGDNYAWNPTTAIFGQQIQLKGYELAVEGNDGIYRPSAGEFKSGESIRVTLWWQADGKPQADYTVFVHALDATGQLAGQQDSPPANGYRPTGAWSAGELIKDIHYLKASQDSSTISVGLYDARSGQRLATNAGSDRVALP